jgi:cAMP-dependent protein kinase regulator
VLKNIDLLSSMDPYERTHVCDGIKEQKFKAGEYVIREVPT